MTDLDQVAPPTADVSGGPSTCGGIAERTRASSAGFASISSQTWRTTRWAHLTTALGEADSDTDDRCQVRAGGCRRCSFRLAIGRFGVCQRCGRAISAGPAAGHSDGQSVLAMPALQGAGQSSPASLAYRNHSSGVAFATAA